MPLATIHVDIPEGSFKPDESRSRFGFVFGEFIFRIVFVGRRPRG